MFPNVRGALTFAAELQDVDTAASVAIGVPELGVETSAENRRLFVVLSALTEGESFDIVMSAGGDHGFESWRKRARKVESVHSGTSTKSLEGDILSPTQMKLPESMGAIEKMEDLVRRC